MFYVCTVQCTVVLIMYVISSMPSLSTLSLLSALKKNYLGLPRVVHEFLERYYIKEAVAQENYLGLPRVVHEFLEKILHKGGSGTRNLLGNTWSMNS